MEATAPLRPGRRFPGSSHGKPSAAAKWTLWGFRKLRANPPALGPSERGCRWRPRARPRPRRAGPVPAGCGRAEGPGGRRRAAAPRCLHRLPQPGPGPTLRRTGRRAGNARGAGRWLPAGPPPGPDLQTPQDLLAWGWGSDLSPYFPFPPVLRRRRRSPIGSSAELGAKTGPGCRAPCIYSAFTRLSLLCARHCTEPWCTKTGFGGPLGAKKDSRRNSYRTLQYGGLEVESRSEEPGGLRGGGDH